MKKALFISTFAVIAACSTSKESVSNPTAAGLSPQAIKFDSVGRCLTVPFNGDLSGRAPMKHGRCGQEDRQAFLLVKDDIKAEGHFGPYVTEKAGQIVAGSSSPWALRQNASGKLVVQSKVSNKCLLAGNASLVVLGDCNDAAASVQIFGSSQLPGRERPRDGGWIVACGTDNQGNAEDCI